MPKIFNNINYKFSFLALSVLYKVRFIKRPEKTALNADNSRGLFPRAYGNKKIYSDGEGNEKIRELILSGKPCMICRFGSTELSVIYEYYLKHGKWKSIRWSNYYKSEINLMSGFFPATDKMISRFAKLFTANLSPIDLLGVWFKPGEDVMVNEFMPGAFLYPLRALEPYYFKKPWSTALKGKRVLVIHPFSESIYNQYQQHRRFLFKEEVLPDFELQVLPAVQSLGTSRTQFKTWFEALEHMKTEIKKRDFDIAIIGAGAYGLPLAAYVKELGKQAIHLGGATQILFGIKGKRWDTISEVASLYNEYWTRPLLSETPASENQADESCYW